MLLGLFLGLLVQSTQVQSETVCALPSNVVPYTDRYEGLDLDARIDLSALPMDAPDDTASSPLRTVRHLSTDDLSLLQDTGCDVIEEKDADVIALSPSETHARFLSTLTRVSGAVLQVNATRVAAVQLESLRVAQSLRILSAGAVSVSLPVLQVAEWVHVDVSAASRVSVPRLARTALVVQGAVTEVRAAARKVRIRADVAELSLSHVVSLTVDAEAVLSGHVALSPTLRQLLWRPRGPPSATVCAALTAGVTTRVTTGVTTQVTTEPSSLQSLHVPHASHCAVAAWLAAASGEKSQVVLSVEEGELDLTQSEYTHIDRLHVPLQSLRNDVLESVSQLVFRADAGSLDPDVKATVSLPELRALGDVDVVVRDIDGEEGVPVPLYVATCRVESLGALLESSDPRVRLPCETHAALTHTDESAARCGQSVRAEASARIETCETPLQSLPLLTANGVHDTDETPHPRHVDPERRQLAVRVAVSSGGKVPQRLEVQTRYETVRGDLDETVHSAEVAFDDAVIVDDLQDMYLRTWAVAMPAAGDSAAVRTGVTVVYADGARQRLLPWRSTLSNKAGGGEARIERFRADDAVVLNVRVPVHESQRPISVTGETARAATVTTTDGWTVTPRKEECDVGENGAVLECEFHVFTRFFGQEWAWQVFLPQAHGVSARTRVPLLTLLLPTSEEDPRGTTQAPTTTVPSKDPPASAGGGGQSWPWVVLLVALGATGGAVVWFFLRSKMLKKRQGYGGLSLDDVTHDVMPVTTPVAGHTAGQAGSAAAAHGLPSEYIQLGGPALIDPDLVSDMP